MYVCSKLGLTFVGQEYRRDKLDLLILGLVDQVLQVLEPVKMGDHFKCVALVDQKLLPFGAVKHLLGILGHERVEKGIESLIVTTFRP